MCFTEFHVGYLFWFSMCEFKVSTKTTNSTFILLYKTFILDQNRLTEVLLSTVHMSTLFFTKFSANFQNIECYFTRLNTPSGSVDSK